MFSSVAYDTSQGWQDGLEETWTERTVLVTAVMYRRRRVILRSQAPQEPRAARCQPSCSDHVQRGHRHAAAEASRYVIHAAREHEESFNK